MKNILSNLKSPPRKARKRLGRGFSSGQGRTAGKGTKGQLSRSGYKRKHGFEGGQTPLVRRVPKRGFQNPRATKYEIVNVDKLNRFKSGATVDPEVLKKVGLRKTNLPLKILGDGELTKPLIVHAHKFSKTAKEKIESSKGEVKEL